MTRPMIPSPALVTTVIPTYRRPKLLRRAIESALEQQGPSLLVRVFDNASGDETASVVAEIAARDPRLHYQCHEKNIGAAANFEFGLRAVNTPFFSILSDDDYLLPRFYAHALDDLEAHPEAMFWAGMTLNVDESGKIWYARVDGWKREGLFAPPEGMLAMMHGMAPVWTGIVFRRDVLDSVGFPDPEALGPSDFDFLLRVAAHHNYILRKCPSAVFTLSDFSFSTTQPLSSFWPGWQKIFRNVETSLTLSNHSKALALLALHKDAKRMLFRRGVNALATERYDYCNDAAAAFEAQYGKGLRPWMLRVVTAVCESKPLLQRFYTWSYRRAERLLIQSRSDLQSRYGNLLKRS
ncbi:MAG: glycosyltransferase family 2 protein [Gammaproteobacteria bacterium]